MSRNARGFTLIEVLVAVAIAAFGLAGVIAMTNQSADTARIMRERTLALYIGLNQITELRLGDTLPRTGRSNGETDYAGRRWRWEQRVIETPVESLRRVEVDVATVARPEDVVRTVTGFVGEPRPPGQANVLWQNLGALGGEPPPEGADR